MHGPHRAGKAGGRGKCVGNSHLLNCGRVDKDHADAQAGLNSRLRRQSARQAEVTHPEALQEVSASLLRPRQRHDAAQPRHHRRRASLQARHRAAHLARERQTPRSGSRHRLPCRRFERELTELVIGQLGPSTGQMSRASP